MNLRLACRAALVALPASALAACSSDPRSAATITSTSTTAAATSTTTNGAACTALGMISGYDIESSQLVGEGDFAALKTFLIDNTPAVLTAYDEAERAEPDLKSAIGTLRAVSTGARDAAIEAHDLSELRTLLRDIPEIAQSGDAANALNAYTQANCGFSTGA